MPRVGLGPLSDACCPPGMGLGPRSNEGGAPWHAACGPPCSEAAEADDARCPERSEHRLEGEPLSRAGELSLSLCRAAIAGEPCRWLSPPCRGSCDWATDPHRSRAEPPREIAPWPGRGLRSGDALALLLLPPPPAALRGGGREGSGMRLSSVGGRPLRCGPNRGGSRK